MTLWQHRGEYHHAVLAEHLNNASAATTDYIHGLGALGGPATRAWGIIDAVVTRQAMTLAVNDVFLFCTVLFVVMIPIVWLAKPPFGNVEAGAGH